MTGDNSESLIIRAIKSLESLDRRQAVTFLRQELEKGDETGERWRSVARLADTIGEIGIAIEASRRLALTSPQTLDRILSYCGMLSQYGRTEDASTIVNGLPADIQEHASALHFLGTLASQLGQFENAREMFRQALVKAPLSSQTWYALSAIKTFTAGDPDIAFMESIVSHFDTAPSEVRAQFLYALGKAYDDAGQQIKALNVYKQGAAISTAAEPFDAAAWAHFDQKIIEDYTPQALATLHPSGCHSERVIFVNGLPRSGTTLVEQILTSHSTVKDGGEINLLRAALIPAGDFSFAGAAAYQSRRTDLTDPWGDVARDYLQMVTERFGPEGRIVDKTLNHSRFMGLLMHSLPKAKVIWLRRDPADCALSCYRTYFATPMPWSRSLSDIAHYFRSEDALYEHWTRLYPDRILTVPYEALVAEPRAWIRKILSHVDLAEEPQVFEPHKHKRSVMTASVAQVRAPISTARIGSAGAYSDLMAEFHKAYDH